MTPEELIRQEVERQQQLDDERAEVELHQQPDGSWAPMPKELFRATDKDGKVRKEKATFGTKFCAACGHRMWDTHIEAQVYLRTGRRPGICQVCSLEVDGQCFGVDCYLCGKFHDSCRYCNRSCCRRCLTIRTYLVKDEWKCWPACKMCQSPAVLEASYRVVNDAPKATGGVQASEQSAKSSPVSAAQQPAPISSQSYSGPSYGPTFELPDGCRYALLVLAAILSIIAVIGFLLMLSMPRTENPRRIYVVPSHSGAASPQNEAVLRLYDEARKLGLLADDVVRRLFLSLLRAPDKDLYGLVKEKVEQAQRAHFLCPRPFQAWLPMRAESRGEIPLGLVMGSGHEYGISPGDRHVLLLGATGRGKSYAVRKVMKALILSGWRLFVFSKKQDARSIATLFSDRVGLFRLSNHLFRYNPLQPSPGVGLAHTQTLFAEAFCQSQGLLTGSAAHIQSRLSELFHLFGTEKDVARVPCLYDLRDRVRDEKLSGYSRDARFQESILNRLDGIMSGIGPVLACSHGLPIERMLSDGISIILEVDGVKDETACYITTDITLRLFAWLLNLPAEERPRVAIFLDDAQELFDKNRERQTDAGLPIMGLMAARFRAAGLMVASTQTPQLTSTLLRQNCATKIILGQNDYEEALVAARMVGMPDDLAGELLRLKTGEAVCFKPAHPYPVKVLISPDNHVEE